MTRKAQTPCHGSPLCPELLPAGKRYCDTHALERNRAKGTPAERGYDAEWWKTRAAYLTEMRSQAGHAYCENCGVSEDDLDTPINVDHIDGLGPKGPRGHDPTNLQALCVVCHGSKTAHQTGTAGGPR